MNKTIPINLIDVQVKDLTGTRIELENLHQIISNHLYKVAQTIPVSDAVRELYYGKEVEVNQAQIQEMLMISGGIFAPIISISLTEYLTEKLNNLITE